MRCKIGHATPQNIVLTKPEYSIVWWGLTLEIRNRLPKLVPILEVLSVTPGQEGGCKATWKREFELRWREAGPPNHHDVQVDSDQ